VALALVLHIGAFVLARSAERAPRHLDTTPIEVAVEPSAPPEAAPKPAPVEAHAPAPAPVPVKRWTRETDDDPYRNASVPTPTKAARVLTADPRSDEPVDLPTVVSGEGTAVGGVQSEEGRGDRITIQREASLRGTPGAGGTGPAKPPAAGPDMSRPIALLGGAAWKCPFPPEADGDQIDRSVVAVLVTVAPDGAASAVGVVTDPGHGFGRAARACALARRYQPALDRSGKPVSSTTLINVRFTR
jgi:protein TonB